MMLNMYIYVNDIPDQFCPNTYSGKSLLYITLRRVIFNIIQHVRLD